MTSKRNKKCPTITEPECSQRWSESEWEIVLAKPYPDEWTDAELEELDRRTAEAVAEMDWFVIGDKRYMEIDHLLSPANMWIAESFKENNIRGFFLSEKLGFNLEILNRMMERSMHEHRGFQHQLLFTNLLTQQTKDSAVYGVQYNYYAGETVGVRGSFSYHGQTDWTNTHFICQVSTESEQESPDFILIIPVPDLSSSLFLLN